MREGWKSRSAFILASIGSAVGLGNAWRFPGLCAKYGGGAFLFAYFLFLFVLGIPILMMEIAIGKKTRAGAPKAMRTLRRGAEPIGWASISSSVIILIYYAIVFAWCILMCILSFKFATTHTTPELASTLWQDTLGVTWNTDFVGDGANIPLILLVCAFLAWALVYGCIFRGTSQLGRIAKYTVFLPVAMLVILAIRGMVGNPYLGDALKALFVPKWESLGLVETWINAMGQSFFSLSIFTGIMIAYGSYVKGKSSIASDAFIIGLSDFGISILSGIVMFTTMYQAGYTVENMSASGIGMAFIIYPSAIASLTSVPAVNAIFGFVFYFLLCTLAVGSAFSMLEAVASGISDKFHVDKKKVILVLTIVGGALSIFLTTGAGVAWIDIIDHFMNDYALIAVAIMETVVVGWFFKTSKILLEINKNAKGIFMPRWWFYSSIKVIAPASASVLLLWQIVVLIEQKGRYSSSYPLYAEILGGWLLFGLAMASGFLMKFILTRSKKGRELEAEKELTWEELTAEEEKEEATEA